VHGFGSHCLLTVGMVPSNSEIRNGLCDRMPPASGQDHGQAILEPIRPCPKPCPDLVF
jgi:hypothetical protein